MSKESNKFSSDWVHEVFDTSDPRDAQLVISALSKLANEQHSEKKELQRQIDEALIDRLTKLYTPNGLEGKVKPSLVRSLIDGESWGVLYCDLNGLKHINDTMGHATGDAAIVIAGTAIRESIRPDDFGVRKGGDEFVVFLRNADEDHSETVKKRITANLESSNPEEIVSDLSQDELHGLPKLTISIGSTTMVADEGVFADKQIKTEVIDAAIKRADDNMYQVKTNS